MKSDIDHDIEHEKLSAAASSVVAAVVLVSIKIIVGYSTGSLGILAEAAHSGLDLIAAFLTFFAVKLSAKPADSEHNYGHGKIENLSAMFETLLLLITCVWIISEAISRLFYKRVDVDVNVWSFVVMAISIAVDFSRSRILMKTAKKYNSQALEADALHFSTDIWSSGVVILGLICVKLHSIFPKSEYLHEADALAAVLVAVLVVYVSIRMGTRTIKALLDTAPSGMEKKIVMVVESLHGVIDCHNVRMRYSGARLFIDIHIVVDGDQTLKEAHRLTELIEEKIRDIAPDSDVTVHPEPHIEDSVDSSES